MFGKQPKDPKSSETPDIPEMMFPSQSPLEDTANQEIEMAEMTKIEEVEQPEVVKIVEKISGIVSPYFIVIVGLSLYDENFFLGLVLIVIGIFSLLKISWSDIFEFFLEVKNIFSSNDEL